MKPLDNMPLPSKLSAGENRGLTDTGKQSAPLGGSSPKIPVLPLGPAKKPQFANMGLGGGKKAPSTAPKYGGA